MTARDRKSVLSRSLAALAGAALLLTGNVTRACTAFWAPGQPATGVLVAKSFDWPSPVGYVVLSEAGLRHQKLSLAKKAAAPMAWTAEHASLSFTTVGPGFPASGMNDAGLVIEALVDFDTRPGTSPDETRPSVLEWVQRGLDLFADVESWADDLVAHGLAQVGPPLHLFGCDRRGCVVVESDGSGGVHVQRHLDPAARVLANKHYLSDRAERGHPPGCLLGLCWNSRGASARRFGKVSKALAEKHTAWSVDEAMALLDEVGDRRGTAWQLVWELEGRAVSFRVPAGGSAVERLTLPPLPRLPASGTATCRSEPQVLSIGPRGLPRTRDWHVWNAGDVSGVQHAVLRQLGRDTAATRELAHAVAETTRNVVCPLAPVGTASSPALP